MNLVYQLYYLKYRQLSRIGSYSGFIRSFCAKPIAPYLWWNRVNWRKVAVPNTYERLVRGRQMVRDAIEFGVKFLKVAPYFAKMSQAHAHVDLTDEHFLYVIANFVIDPMGALRQY